MINKLAFIRFIIPIIPTIPTIMVVKYFINHGLLIFIRLNIRLFIVFFLMVRIR